MKQYVKCIYSETHDFKVGKQYPIISHDGAHFTLVDGYRGNNNDLSKTKPFKGSVWKFELVKEEKTMKKFKNKFAVTGSKHLLEAFTKELVDIGHTPNKTAGKYGWFGPTNPKECRLIINQDDTNTFGFHNHKGGCTTVLDLPAQWDEALKLAKEEVVQELEFEVGKWYVFEENPENLVCCTDPVRSINYGFWNGEWRTDLIITYSHYNTEDWRLATDEEVKEALITEAKKRGFKVGIKYTDVENGQHRTVVRDIETAGYYSRNVLQCSSSIYHQGKWAEILPNHPSITVNGYKAEFFDTHVKFGCARFDKTVFEVINQLNGQMSNSFNHTNRGITSIKLGSGEFTIKQIQEINNYFVNK